MVGEVGMMEGGQFFLVVLVEFVRQLLSMEDHVTLVEPFTEEVCLSVCPSVCYIAILCLTHPLSVGI